MRFDIYGRFQIEVQRKDGAWAVYRLAPGKRVPFGGVMIPASMAVDEIAAYLDDIYHELARPGDEVRVVES